MRRTREIENDQNQWGSFAYLCSFIGYMMIHYYIMMCNISNGLCHTRTITTNSCLARWMVPPHRYKRDPCHPRTRSSLLTRFVPHHLLPTPLPLPLHTATNTRPVYEQHPIYHHPRSETSTFTHKPSISSNTVRSTSYTNVRNGTTHSHRIHTATPVKPATPATPATQTPLSYQQHHHHKQPHHRSRTTPPPYPSHTRCNRRTKDTCYPPYHTPNTTPHHTPNHTHSHTHLTHRHSQHLHTRCLVCTRNPVRAGSRHTVPSV